MATYKIELGPAERLAVLYTYPNLKNDTSTLAKTIEHWFELTLIHDGLKIQPKGATKLTGVKLSVLNEREYYTLVLEGPASYADEFRTYCDRLPKFLEHGWTAYQYDVARIREGRAIKPWDPVLNDWRFFLTHGLTLARPKSVQFFHYPPIRLLALQNYLDDPVPFRCEELLVANGVGSLEEARQFEAVMDACPIGASDEQGGLGTIPIDEFYSYQAAQTRLLVGDPKDKTFPWKKSSTIPIVVYGKHPKRVFSHLFLGQGDKVWGVHNKESLEENEKLKADGKRTNPGRSFPKGKLESDTVCTAKNIIPGKSTAVVGSTHPYAFYAGAQIGPWGTPAKSQGHVGQGCIHPSYAESGSSSLSRRMIKDLAVAGWQKIMADKPTKNPLDVLTERTNFWSSDAQWPTVCEYIIHQGSLWYPCFAEGKEPDPNDTSTCTFEFKLDLKQAAGLCRKYKHNLADCIRALAEKHPPIPAIAGLKSAKKKSSKKAGKKKRS